MKRRPPLRGYNHNVRHAGLLFHVQTEDSGPGRPQLTTHVFLRGSILATARTAYDPEALEEEVQRLMQGQHKAALRQLRDGVFDEKAAALRVALPVEEPAPAPEARALERLDAPGALVATTEPYNPAMTTLEQGGGQRGISPLSDAELAELVDLAAGSLEAPETAFSQSSYQTLDAEGLDEEPERVVELEAEPPSEDEVRQLKEEASGQPEPGLAEPPSAQHHYPSSRSPRLIAVLAPTGGYMARQHYSNPPAPPSEPRPLDDLPAEPTRIRLLPATRNAASGRPTGRTFRTTARRLDASPFRPRPTAEGVVVQRPVIVTDQGASEPVRRPTAPAPGTEPKPPQPSGDERSLDQVILAYLAEDTGKKK